MPNTLLRQTLSDTSSTLSDYTISYISQIENDKDYYHPCYKVVVSMDHAFSCLIDGEVLPGLRAMIINQKMTHSFSSEGTNLLICLIKADSVYGHELNTLLSGEMSCLDLATVFKAGQLENILPANYQALDASETKSYVEAFLYSIVDIRYTSKDSPVNKKIQRLLAFIDHNLMEPFEIEEVALSINLSTDRTRHLFTQQMGFPMIQYISWKRIKKTISIAKAENSTLTQACLQLGFNDQSHFNHTFKLILGIKPKEILHSRQIFL